jgi:hypothetical protein
LIAEIILIFGFKVPVWARPSVNFNINGYTYRDLIPNDDYFEDWMGGDEVNGWFDAGMKCVNYNESSEHDTTLAVRMV